MNSNARLKSLVEAARKLPPPTRDQLDEWSLAFSYDNLACTMNHKPRRDAFKQVATRMGWSEERFDKWAAEREWWS